jgi:hypothetical protein
MSSPKRRKNIQISQRPGQKNFLVRRTCYRRALKAPLPAFALLAVVLLAGGTIKAQETCPNIETNGGESISAKIRIDSTGASVNDQDFVPRYTRLRLDSRATPMGNV